MILNVTWIIWTMAFFAFILACSERYISKSKFGPVFWILAIFYLFLTIISIAFSSRESMIYILAGLSALTVTYTILSTISGVELSLPKQIRP